MSAQDLKTTLERKLCNAITGLIISSGKNSLKEIWLDLGIVAGFDSALRDYCLTMGEPTSRSFRNSHFLPELDSYSFRKLTLAEIKNFAFPKTVYQHEVQPIKEA